MPSSEIKVASSKPQSSGFKVLNLKECKTKKMQVANLAFIIGYGIVCPPSALIVGGLVLRNHMRNKKSKKRGHLLMDNNIDNQDEEELLSTPSSDSGSDSGDSESSCSTSLHA
ncbi:hypothetical protein CYY_003111 [Polysphondylium violaceum]|uniref:Transmembrane protein n=1 Tax=Polysphondylium violaceum TaxID=133409 RepID=A0A8J4V1L7_9MYCE|nr:hypothetical protein CYY_003111 [Polysphondylium violaceum]